MARKMTEWPSKRGPITKIMPSDGCIGDTVPLAVGKWYEFHEFGWHMGNVGFNIRPNLVGQAPHQRTDIVFNLCEQRLIARGGLQHLLQRADGILTLRKNFWIKGRFCSNDDFLDPSDFIAKTQRASTGRSQNLLLGSDKLGVNLRASFQPNTAGEQSAIGLISDCGFQRFPNTVGHVSQIGCIIQRHRQYGPAHYVTGHRFEIDNFAVFYCDQMCAFRPGFPYMTPLQIAGEYNVRL